METSQADRNNMRAHAERVDDSGLRKLVNDADRLAQLQDGIRALAEKWQNEAGPDAGKAVAENLEECADDLRALLSEGE